MRGAPFMSSSSSSVRRVFPYHRVARWVPSLPIRRPASMLLRLPPELRVEVASHLEPAGLLALGAACRACRAAADHDSLWRELLHRQLRPMLQAFFDGVLPPPEAPGRSWKRHYFDFRSSWKRLAQKRTGRLLVQIGKQRPSGRVPHELISMLDVSELWWPPRPANPNPSPSPNPNPNFNPNPNPNQVAAAARELRRVRRERLRAPPPRRRPDHHRRCRGGRCHAPVRDQWPLRRGPARP